LWEDRRQDNEDFSSTGPLKKNPRRWKLHEAKTAHFNYQ
jgi:hypothetical protein